MLKAKKNKDNNHTEPTKHTIKINFHLSIEIDIAYSESKLTGLVTLLIW